MTEFCQLFIWLLGQPDGNRKERRERRDWLRVNTRFRGVFAIVTGCIAVNRRVRSEVQCRRCFPHWCRHPWDINLILQEGYSTSPFLIGVHEPADPHSPVRQLWRESLTGVALTCCARAPRKKRNPGRLLRTLMGGLCGGGDNPFAPSHSTSTKGLTTAVRERNGRMRILEDAKQCLPLLRLGR